LISLCAPHINPN